jgi:hypothetical protein
MPKTNYTQHPYKVTAEQYAAANPVPPEMCTCTVTPPFPTGQPHVHTPEGVFAPAEGDWIVVDVWTPHTVRVLTNAEFSDRFGGAIE